VRVETNENRDRPALRAGALPAVALAALLSVACTLWVGRRNPSYFLMLLFTVWVLSPFVGLLLAERRSARWSVAARTALHSVMLILAAGSVAAYGKVALWPPRSTPAATFLMVPLGSWLLMTVVLTMTAFVSARRSRPSGRS
jgi:hypothetical protein